MQETR
jgi:hypothetical protein